MKIRHSMTGRIRVIDALIVAFVLAVVGAAIAATHPPHNETNGISCDSCHWTHGTPEWWDETPADIDDQPRNRVCWQSGCHDGVARPHMKTHSSLATSATYGEWTWLCVNCHDPHQQRQAYYNEFRVYGKITGVNAATRTFTLSTALPDLTGDGDPSDDYVGWTIVPNRLYRTVNYKIEDNTANTVTVTGAIQTTRVGIGSDYGILVGRYLKDVIYTPGGAKYVKFYVTEGERSYAHNDGLAGGNDGSPDGVCQVCHGIRSEGAEIRHSRADGTKLDHNSGTNCIRCHPHTNGFAHGGGSGGTGCIECHGHDAGYEYASGKFSQGRGTFGSHSTHTENDSDDRRGPNVNCDACHDTNNFPYFKSGTDTNGDGRYDLSETDVCNPCHSPQGNYDGVNDREIGAKKNWKNGVYVGNALRSGKEKWCAGCHDSGTSVVSGVNAPNVIGDESGAYTYGTGWGYYKTGHGLPSDETYPASGGITAGVGATCDNCHDLSTAHIDGNARTFDDHNSSSTSPSEYRQGYRLKLINGQEPMMIPKTGRSETSNYRLCVSCHTNTAAFTDPSSTQTNFRDTTNRHYYHLDIHDQNRWSADWDFAAYTSRITCITCHNVHGSTRLAMMRDGNLINREPGIRIWYYNAGISTNTNPPFPEDLPLSASTGLIWLPGSAGNVCSACHGGTTQEIFGPRDPFQDTAQAPVMDWTGENGYASDGATPDSASSGSSFTFRVKYTDTNNDAPDASTGVQLWIDSNNDGIYESTYAMAGINDADNTYLNGKIYAKTLTLTNAGSNIVRYRFYAKDATGRDATGPATGVSSVTLTTYAINNTPVLSWVSGSCRFEGVSPAAQVSGAVLDFRVRYTDADNNAPANMQVWVDVNDNGSYEAGEKYDMTRDGGDGDYRDGETFTRSLTLNYVGDGKINYRFVASDGATAAAGVPAVDHRVTVINDATSPTTVCASGCNYTSIQAAVDAINGAHTVLVYPGTYNERVYFSGANDNDTIVRSVCGPDDTIINASGVAYGVEVTGSTGSVVDGFGIANGTIGVYLHHGSASTNLTIENCRVHDNSGGGIYSGDTSSITVNNSEIYANTAGTGAGIYLMEGVSSINDTIIRDNHATANGGGVGTGLWNNSTFANTTIKDNIADGSGGGFAQTSDSSTAAFYKCTIRGNRAATGSGGGLYIQGEGGTYGVSLANTIVADNEAPSGGAVWQDGNLSASNCTIANNRATGATGGGGAIYANTGGGITIRNSIIWNNAAPAVGSRHIAYLSSTTPMTISDSILNNDGNTTFNRYPYFVVQDGGSLPTISGFVSGADPFFVDASGGDYHIQSISEAIDHASAVYAPADDIDSDARPQGTAPDIGADEYRSSTANSSPVLTWTGEVNYTEDGVAPDSGENGSSFTFRVHYADAGGGTPEVIQLWLDRNDDDVYEASEKYVLSPVGGGIYATTIAPLTAAGDGDLNYRFYASDGVNDAVGEPTGNSAVRVIAPSVTFGSAAQTTVNESGAATLTVQLSSASSEAVTVPFTVNGSSTATGGGVDYHITASPIAIAAGSTTANITISLISDTLNENNETVVVDMGAPTNAVRGAITTHTLTITDDDPAPTVIFTTSSQATAGEDGTATITAQLSAASGKDVTVPFTVNGSSTATGGGFDYSMSASPVTIPAGSTTADITVSITSDNLDEDHETVIVDMGAPTNATQGAITTHALTITDDDPAPAVTFTTASQMTAMESGSYTITAQLSAASGRVVTVPFTVNATSTATGGGVDYHITASPIAIAAGSTTANITMTIIADSLVEGNETVIVDMGAPINATQGAITTHTLTIRDDDGAQIAVCSTNPAPFNKIQTTIADAGTTNGSTLLVCAGTYPEKINFLGKDITVKAESGASVTFIIGDNTNSPVVTFSSGENSTAVLDGFTIDNQAAAGTATRGISISASSAPTIRNCVVKGNQLSTGQNGAGIYINGGTATIQSSTIGGEAFNKNSCQTGCGIYATALTETLSISNSTISENAGTGTGGGIYLSANGTQATNITGTAFTNNTGQNGGAIYNNGTILSISGSSSFNANSVSSGTGGGAIHSTGAGASTTIDGATFTGNASSNQGGAIYITGSTAATPLSISNCTFTNNAATLYGAAVALNSITNATTISSTTITGGSGGSSSKGAGIYTSAAPLTLTNTNVNNNTSALEGGGIWASGAASVITITGGSVSGNSGTSGSGIYLTSSATLTATGTTISNNTSSSTSGSGGGIYAANGVTITDGTFANNAAGSSSGQGGAIYSSSSVTLNGANTFTGNHASNGGGAIFLSSGSVAVNNSGNIFTGNYTTSNSGGAIFVTDGGSVAFAGIAGAIFTGNYATNAGGGAIITGNATIHNATFTGNYAKDNGGAFYPLSGTSYIYNSTFETNSLTTTSTTYGGGAIYMKNAVYYLNIYNSTFVGNSAGAGRGGAVYANTNASANIYNSTFYNNTSSYSSPVNHLHASSSGYIKLYNALVAHPSGAVLCNNTARGGTSVNLEYNNSGTACAASSVTGDPKLSVLADNGGLTRTMALQTGSAAMDAADDATCLTTDQRGLSRPVDGDSNGSAVCDIGAFEYVP